MKKYTPNNIRMQSNPKPVITLFSKYFLTFLHKYVYYASITKGIVVLINTRTLFTTTTHHHHGTPHNRSGGSGSVYLF